MYLNNTVASVHTRFTYDGADEIVGAAETVGLFVGVTDG